MSLPINNQESVRDKTAPPLFTHVVFMQRGQEPAGLALTAENIILQSTWSDALNDTGKIFVSPAISSFLPTEGEVPVFQTADGRNATNPNVQKQMVFQFHNLDKDTWRNLDSLVVKRNLVCMFLTTKREIVTFEKSSTQSDEPEWFTIGADGYRQTGWSEAGTTTPSTTTGRFDLEYGDYELKNTYEAPDVVRYLTSL